MTDQALTTFLWFDTEAEQAASFYAGIFKDSRLAACTGIPRRDPGRSAR